MKTKLKAEIIWDPYRAGIVDILRKAFCPWSRQKGGKDDCRKG